MRKLAGGLVCVCIAWLSMPSAIEAQRAVRGGLLIAAAASLGHLAPQLARVFHDQRTIDVRFNFGGSNTLARQIIEGARVDVFISADEMQMDLVEQAGRIVPGSRVDVIGNQLVVIVPVGERTAVTNPDDLTRSHVRRVAMGDPEAVPIGVYGRRWLEMAGLWSGVRSKVVPLPTSPAVVAAVREGRADAGIVYTTDVGDPANRNAVRVVHEVPIHDAPSIVYPAAVIRGGREPWGRVFVEFLQSPAARKIFQAAGFRVPPSAGSPNPLAHPWNPGTLEPCFCDAR